MPLDKDHLVTLLAAGKTREAIDEIIACKEDIAEQSFYQVVALSAELAENEKNERNRTVSQEVINVQKNGINTSLTKLLPLLDKQAAAIPTVHTPQNDTSGASPEEPDSELGATIPKVEKWVETLAYVIVQIAKRPWKYKLINLLAFCLVFLNPFVLGQALKLIQPDSTLLEDINYLLYFGIGIGLLFAMAIALAIRDMMKGGESYAQVSYSDQSPIKGLRHFEFEDAEIFRKLQRHQDIETCLQGIGGRDYRFGVLTGESGCGKTSFLRAGLYPAIKSGSTPCIVVKLRNEAPLASIRKALADQIPMPESPAASVSLKELFHFYQEKTGLSEWVLIVDQFEQFFTQYKLAEDRQSFIQQLKECYEDLPEVKILLSLRKDYQGYLYEIQDVLGYALVTRSNYFDLKKFTPTQATEIFRVMAETEGLEFDTSFVYNTCKEELA
ncbi:MAG: AAA family ATPase, partial [Bacteroidota bacterium]